MRNVRAAIHDAKSVDRNCKTVGMVLMAKRGPKVIQLDWEQFDKLCYIQCTQREIAAWFDCSVDTIERRVEEEFGIKFAEYYAEKKEKGLISLRRLQYQAAEKANTVMLIWLGKQYLGQKDRQETEMKTSTPIQIKIDSDDSKA